MAVDTSWYPAKHTYDGTRLVLPHYATMPDYIQVYDTQAKYPVPFLWMRNMWRLARNRALARWGYPYEVKELKQTDAYRPEGITLGTFVPDPQYGPNSYGGFGLHPIAYPWTSEFDQWTWDKGKGFALIHPTEVQNAFASRVVGRLSGVICHEVGHALGFGHGGTGIMRSAVEPPYHPNDEELAALEAYWGKA